MNAELVVMTSEKVDGRFKIYRAPIDNIDHIPRAGILFIVVSCSDDIKPRLNGRRRLCQSCGHDWYTFIVQGRKVLLAGWNDGDFEWHSLDNPWAESSTIRPDHLPMARGITFKGKRIPDDEWQQAITQFMDEMH